MRFNNKKIKEEIKKNGYYIFKAYFTNQELKKIKESLLNTLHYIKPDNEKDLQKKYYQIKKYNPKLKGNWYDMARYDINILQLIYKPEIINFVKEFFNTKVVFSGRPAIHVHDDENDKLVDPHQEAHNFAKDTIALWAPLYDTNKDQGGLSIYKDSHKHGYFKHFFEHPNLGNKSWTKEYTHIDPKVIKKFKKVDLKVKAGSAILMHSSVIHCSYPTKKKGKVRITLTERFNPLQKIPFLKKEDAPLRWSMAEPFDPKIL